MWKSADTDAAREELNNFWKPSAVLVLLFAFSSFRLGIPSILTLVIWSALGGVFAGGLVVAWRRRFLFTPQSLFLAVLLVHYAIQYQLPSTNQRYAGLQGFFLTYLVFYSLLYLCRHQIIKFARLEPAIEL